jgi:outer membrane immunogenic protein
MYRLSFAVGAAALAFAQLAVAADLPRKAPVYVPPPVYNWTGFYVGVNAGGSIGRDPTTITQSGLGPGSFISSNTMSPAGFIGGGQLGYNYQFAPNWVVGVEGDFQGASQKDSSCFLDCGGDIFFGQTVTVNQKLEWFATARARLGYTNGDWLWYVTGGGAWAKVHNDLAISGIFFGSANFNQNGWVVGGGVETHLGGNWTGKLEYLYMDLGSLHDLATSVPPLLTASQTSDIRDHIVRVGLNYKVFGAAPNHAGTPPVAYNAPQRPGVWNWTGLYIGANAGGGIGRNRTDQSNDSLNTSFASFTLSPAGFVGGGQIGYNYQFLPNLVVGFEGDIQGTSQRDSSCIGAGCTSFGSFYFTIEQKLNWFATARARFGYASGDWLWYVTGGGAWGEVHNDFRTFTPLDVAFVANFNRSGWTVGGGVETHIIDRWTAKLEYLYLDLGSFVDGGLDPLSGFNFSSKSEVRDHIVRVGLNYKIY